MPSHDRRAAARRRAWGRGPIILRFEPLEGRQLLATAHAQPLPDLVASAFTTAHNLDWGDPFHAVGQITNQGGAAADAPFTVNIYASTRPRLTSSAVKIGEVTVPAGLAPGQSVPFDQAVSLPDSPIPGLGASTTVFIDLFVNQDRAAAESDYANDHGLGQGLDVSPVTITPHPPADLIGTSLGLDQTQASWGGTITLTAQIRNNAGGDAPATRARVVLTPAGQAPGGPNDVTVGSIAVPAIPAWQTVNVVQPITLPAHPPVALAGGTQYTLTMVQDADFATNPLYPPPAPQGLGRDQAALQINPAPASTDPLPNLAAASVLAPHTPLTWGQSFQVATSVQNVGQGDAGSFLVQYFLVGANGTLDHALFLGESTIPGLKAGYNQDLVQTLKLPARLPAGLALNSKGVGRIAVVVDPEHTVNEPYQNNKMSESAPVILRVLGTDGTSTVPTQPGSLISASATPTLNQPKNRGKLRRQAPPPVHHTLAYEIGHQMTVVPRTVGKWLGIIK